MNMVAKTWKYGFICMPKTGFFTDQSDREVDSHYSLKKERFEVVWHVGDDDQKNSWDVHRKDSSQ